MRTGRIIIGLLIIMFIGNARLLQGVDTALVITFIVVYLTLLLISWIIGEYYYRKRHMKKHQPLIKNISDLIKELEENTNNT